MALRFFGNRRSKPAEPVSEHVLPVEAAVGVNPELIGRLHRLEWPDAPEDVKHRVLQRVLEEGDLNGAPRSRRD